jgi:hypothetical protein
MLRKQLMEHRWGTRIPLSIPAEIKAGDGRRGSATVRNASVSGAFLETDQKFPVLSRLCVRPLSRPEPGLDAHVVRAEPDGVAVEWSHPGAHPVSDLMPLRDVGGLRQQDTAPRHRLMSRDPEDTLVLEF